MFYKCNRCVSNAIKSLRVVNFLAEIEIKHCKKVFRLFFAFPSSIHLCLSVVARPLNLARCASLKSILCLPSRKHYIHSETVNNHSNLRSIRKQK